MKTRGWLLPALALCAAGLGCQVSRILSGTPINALNTPEPAGSAPVAPTPAPAATSNVTEYQVADEGHFHIDLGQTVQYQHYPPSSGLHYGQVLDWGLYNKEVPPEYWVHSLEHGGIVILYRCPSACPGVVDTLDSLIHSAHPESHFNEIKILISPNSRIDYEVVALAWDWELDLNAADPTTLLGFYDRHIDKGPEDVP